MTAGSRPLRVLLRLAIVAAVVTAVVIVELSSRSGVLWRLITFTYQANVLAAAFYVATLLSPRVDARAVLRGAVVVYVVVAGLVWNLFLTDYSMGYTPANFLLHVVVPVLALAEWALAVGTQSSLRWWHPWAWLVYPAAYVAVALAVLNRAGRRAPYYFLDPQTVGTAAVAVNIGLLGAIFVGLGYALMAVGRTAAAVGERAQPDPT
ncbi:Pr6Pr family membrane protein [Mycolicibacterium sp. F2034L]|uniref:Pr6Pr family membrane protein n=1 Tax=Mycolicibacterium sp. F2034L TaxID=2926422 RepID=UPI001FF4FA4A|nr:Pr6Pr family membrane protein [Mycolicibacterium sp. F2034L]MCK0174134.1 Pr6Pr family membrane protein [Mycolicibacterium sp. F2034L]